MVLTLLFAPDDFLKSDVFKLDRSKSVGACTMTDLTALLMLIRYFGPMDPRKVVVKIDRRA